MAASTAWAALPWGITAVLPSQAAHHKLHITWSSSRSFFPLKWKALLVTNCPQHELEWLQTLSPLWAQPKWEIRPGSPTVVFTRRGYSSLQERERLPVLFCTNESLSDIRQSRNFCRWTVAKKPRWCSLSASPWPINWNIHRFHHG